MLWGTGDEKTSHKVEEFTQEPEEIEEKLLPYDILGTLAHVEMLEKEGYLAEEELDSIETELKKLYEQEDHHLGDFEDVHTLIEEKVTEETKAGKKIHTGRSRNDQVVTATRLLMKDASVEISHKTLELIDELETFAEEENTRIPGYTHQQQAMPSSTALWASSYVDALIDDLKLLKKIYEVMNSNPLGAAAGFGTSLNINRDYTTETLGFKQKQHNPIYCVSRGKHELMLLQVLSHMMLDIQKLCEDLINFSEDQKIFELPEKFCTGSSIMPQKKNPDVLEIGRANAEKILGHQRAVEGIISKLPHGYNRDTQQTKKHMLEAIQTTVKTTDIIKDLIGGLEIAENFEVKEEVFAAYTVNQKVEEEKPFREAYHEVKEEQEYETGDTVQGPEHQVFKDLEKFWKDEATEMNKIKKKLVKVEE